MEHNKQLGGLIGPEESQRILGALHCIAARAAAMSLR